ncbi:unnamed protein product [Polarella glacialis]|uniref:Phytanoyl-CoA dioxygenase n=1 Tax=Polarella glacialis TaxID=89957 RepID=A0A813L194_POLGL|nr:unnamed protein product [Polarella glacialis]
MAGRLRHAFSSTGCCLFWHLCARGTAALTASPEDVGQMLRIMGYVVLPNLLTEETVVQMRAGFQTWRAKHPDALLEEVLARTVPDILSYPEIQEAFKPLLSSPSLDAALSAYFEGQPYRILRHSDVGVNRMVGHWHKDYAVLGHRRRTMKHQRNLGTRSTDVWGPPADGSPYKILRLAIYLQDHRNGRALSVIQASHLRNDSEMGSGEIGHVALNPSLGDLIVWDMRLTHRGALRNTQDYGTDRLLFTYSLAVDNSFTEEHEQESISREEAQKKSALLSSLSAAQGGLVQKESPCDGQHCCLEGLSAAPQRPRLLGPSHSLSWIAQRYRRGSEKLFAAADRPPGPATIPHAYTEYYGPLLDGARERVQHVLQVGGSFAAQVWRDFFPNARVWAVAVDDEDLA